jgi:hypothetical protein
MAVRLKLPRRKIAVQVFRRPSCATQTRAQQRRERHPSDAVVLKRESRALLVV